MILAVLLVCVLLYFFFLIVFGAIALYKAARTKP